MNLSSKKVNVHTSSQETYEFLSDPANYKSLMPSSIEKFELNDEGGFLFKLKGMPEIPLVLKEKEPFSKVVWGSGNNNFKFSLIIDIQEIATGESEAQILFDGDFNPMIAMMVKKPLQKFIGTLAENMEARNM